MQDSKQHLEPLHQCLPRVIKEEYPLVNDGSNLVFDDLPKLEEDLGLHISDVDQEQLANIKEEQLEDYNKITKFKRESTVEDEILKPEAVYLRMEDDGDTFDGNCEQGDKETCCNPFPSNTVECKEAPSNWQLPTKEACTPMKTSPLVLTVTSVPNETTLSLHPATVPTPVHTNTNALNGSSSNWNPPLMSTPVLTSTNAYPGTPILVLTNVGLLIVTPSQVLGNTGFLQETYPGFTNAGALNGNPSQVLGNTGLLQETYSGFRNAGAFNGNPSQVLGNTNLLQETYPGFRNAGALNGNPSQVLGNANLLQETYPGFTNTGTLNGNPSQALGNTSLLQQTYSGFRNAGALNGNPSQVLGNTNLLQETCPGFTNAGTLNGNPSQALGNTSLLQQSYSGFRNAGAFNGNPSQVLGNTGLLRETYPGFTNTGALNGNPSQVLGNTGLIQETYSDFRNAGAFNGNPSQVLGNTGLLQETYPGFTNTGALDGNPSQVFGNTGLIQESYSDFRNAGAFNEKPSQVLPGLLQETCSGLSNTGALKGAPPQVLGNTGLLKQNDARKANTGTLNGSSGALTQVHRNAGLFKQNYPGFNNTGALKVASSKVLENTRLFKQIYPGFPNTSAVNGTRTQVFGSKMSLLTQNYSGFTNTSAVNQTSSSVEPLKISEPVVTNTSLLNGTPASVLINPGLNKEANVLSFKNTRIDNGTLLYRKRLSKIISEEPLISVAPSTVLSKRQRCSKLKVTSSNNAQSSTSFPVFTSSAVSKENSTNQRSSITSTSTLTSVNVPNETSLPVFRNSDEPNQMVHQILKRTDVDLLIRDASSVFTNTDVLNGTSSDREQPTVSKTLVSLQKSSDISKIDSSKQMPSTKSQPGPITTNVPNKNAPLSIATSIAHVHKKLSKSVPTNPGDQKRTDPLFLIHQVDALSEISSTKKDVIKESFSTVFINSYGPKGTSEKEKDVNSENTLLNCESETEDKDQEEYSCDSCGQVFYDSNMLTLHEHDGNCSTPDTTREVHSCKTCSQLFLTKDNLIRHIECNIHCRFKSPADSEASKKAATPQSVEANGSGPVIHRYSCHLCDESFAQSSRLVSHHKLCHETVEENFCEVCETGFETKRVLENHLCVENCEKSDVSETSPEFNNLNQHDRQKKFVCDVCDISFESQPELQKHHCEDPDDPRPTPTHYCSVCKEAIDSLEELREHQSCYLRKEDSQKKKYKNSTCESEVRVYKEGYNCANCSQVFPSMATLVLHQETSKCSSPDVSSETYNCKTSNQLFLTHEKLIRHQEFNIHCRPKSLNSEANKKESAPQSVDTDGSGNVNNRYTCHLCDQSFARRGWLVLHHNRCHETVEEIFCDICETTFKTERILKLHTCVRERKNFSVSTTVRKNVGEENILKDHPLNNSNVHKRLKYSCNACDTALETQLDLQEHHCTPDDPGPNHFCAECKEVFDTKENLQKHERFHFTTIKENQKVFVCKMCSVAFKTSGSLQTHQLSHPSGQKITRYFCDSCDETFEFKSVLETHLYKVHSKEKPFKCEICKKSFVREKIYRRHFNTLSHLQTLERLSFEEKYNSKDKRKYVM